LAVTVILLPDTTFRAKGAEVFKVTETAQGDLRPLGVGRRHMRDA
jgi:hypothetical protein